MSAARAQQPVLEGKPERHDFFTNLASQLAGVDSETAVARLAEAILMELELELATG